MHTLVNLIFDLFFLYSIALFIYILMSWIPAAYESKFGQLLGKICDPYLDIFRRFIPPLGMIDISPLVALFALNLAKQGLENIVSAFLF